LFLLEIPGKQLDGWLKMFLCQWGESIGHSGLSFGW
jgi:hypothetical protein